MVEVFKTNVRYKKSAKGILTAVKNSFPYYICNFDLDDCDKILRVQNLSGTIESEEIIKMINEQGQWAEILPD